MPKVSFRMASASREWVFGVQTNTARKIHRSDHTEGRLTTAPSGCCVRKGTVTGTRRASIVGHEGDRGRDDVDDLAAGLVDQLDGAAVGAQIVETKHALGFGDGRVQASESVGAAGRWSDGGGEAELGGVVDHRTDAPDPARRRLELAEVGLPDPVAVARRSPAQ